MRQPKSPFQFKTHAVRSPIATHYRKATCAEVNCTAHRDGWAFHKETLSPEFLYVATKSGRKFREVHIAPGQTYLVYEPGQTCFEFRSHVLPLDRPELYYVGRGDSRVFNPNKARQHVNAVDFMDDFASHLDRMHRHITRG